MNVRLPSVRHPRSFYDVFSLVAAAVIAAAIVLTVRYGSLVRIEMAVFVAIAFVWAFWAIERILARTGEPSNRRRPHPRNRWR